jgi:ketosteroid isomerase-like protein
MPSSHEHQRERLARVFDDLGRGDGTSLRHACAPDVSWWLPLEDTENRGISDVEKALVSALGGKEAELQSVILNVDAGSAVVEQLLRGTEGASTPATSVLTLRDGVVITGRTYLDVAAWRGVAEKAQHA